MKYAVLILVFSLFGQVLLGQEFEIDVQLRPRFEYRNGYKTLLTQEQEPISLVSQRSRLNLNFKNENLKLKLSLQNIRFWGDVPTTSVSDKNGVAVFEAFAVYQLNKNWHVKAGRQVVSYDNQRIFGEIDWAPQGQSHDALLITYLPSEKQRLDLGLALNAAADDLYKVPYEVNSYKNMQFAWYHLDYKAGGLSLLFLNTGYEFENPEEETELDYMQTFGPYFKFNENKWAGDIALYGQTGKRHGKSIKAFYAGANGSYKATENWKIGLGTEYLSGTDLDNTAGSNQSFFPLFGTNHAFNGFMDYFYVGNHQNSVGLADFYGKINYTRKALDISLSPHFFYSAAQIVDDNSKTSNSYLGTEIDLMGSYKLRKDVSISMGYSQIFGSGSLEILKGGDADKTQNWAWIMVSAQPVLFTTPARK